MKIDTTTSEFTNGGKAMVEQILALEERNKSKNAELWESQSGIRVGKLTFWVRLFEKGKFQQSSPGLLAPPEDVSRDLC